MRLLWKSQLANADQGGEGVNQMWRACGRIDCKADWCCHKRMIMAIGAGAGYKKNIWWSEMNWQWKTVKNMREWQGDGEALIGFEHWMNTKRWRAGYRTNRLCPRLLNHSPVFVITIKSSVSSPCTPQYLQISNQMFFEFKKNPFFSSRHTARRNKQVPILQIQHKSRICTDNAAT